MRKHALHLVVVSLFILLISCNANNPKSYTISFDSNGADGGSPPDPIIISPQDPPVSAPSYGSLYKTGYSFCGWSTEQNNPDEKSLIHSGDLLNLPKDTTLYALWDIPCQFLSAGGGSCYYVACNNKNIEYCSIPSEYNGKLVPIINNYAFSDCRFLKSVTLSEGLTSIGNYAFQRCISLQSIALPESLTSIYMFAFRGCTALKSIILPDSLKDIETCAFKECISLEEITIPSSVETITSGAFQGCTSLQSVTLVEGLKEINKEAFQGCTSLIEITIPSSVTMIKQNVFQGCTALKSVTLSEGLTYIGEFAFNKCSSLTEITIPSSVITIESSSFEGCSTLQSITYKGTKAQWGSIEKKESWDANTGDYTIHCTDGDIVKGN